MSTRKFKEADTKYQKTKHWKFIYYMYQQSSSYDDYKKIVHYIIDSGVYKSGMPKEVGFYEREEQWILKDKFKLLATVLNCYRVCCETEEQLVEYINLSLANDLWTAYHSYHIGTSPDSKAIHALRKVATTFEAYYLLYLYDYYDSDRTNSYILKLITLGKSGEQREKLTDASLIVAEKVNRLKNMD